MPLRARGGIKQRQSRKNCQASCDGGGGEFAASALWQGRLSITILWGVAKNGDAPFLRKRFSPETSHEIIAILTENAEAAARFFNELDSAILMHNASTQFADGGEFGMGAEIGIATGKMHARGPVGAMQLTSYKYCVRGDGTVRS